MTEQLLAQQLESPSGTGRDDPGSTTLTSPTPVPIQGSPLTHAFSLGKVRYLEDVRQSTENRSVRPMSQFGPWGFAVLALVVSGAFTLLFLGCAYYFWFEVQPRQVATGLLWLVVALLAPLAALLARRVGMRRGRRGPALLTQVSATALVATSAALSLFFVLYVVSMLFL